MKNKIPKGNYIGFSPEQIERMTGKYKFKISDFKVFEDLNLLKDKDEKD